MSKQNKIIIGIISTLCLVIIISITYAAFTGQLQINGTANVRDSKWDIHIVEEGQLEPSNITGSARVLTKPTASSTSISDFNLSLTTPGDYIEYTFHVINDGDYDATLSDLDKNGVTCTANGSTSDPEAVKVCEKLEYTLKYDNGSNVSQGDTILSKETKTLVLKIKYQEFDDSTLLPTTNVTINGLGISINYSQSGSAKDNSGGNDPYDYHIGDTFTLNGDSYHIIADSLREADYVVAFKDVPLTKDEILAASGEALDVSDTGAMSYRINVFDEETGEVAVEYDTSDVKPVIDSWSQLKFTNNQLKSVELAGYGNYKARLALIEELQPIGWPNCDLEDGYCALEEITPSWIYYLDDFYWTMSPMVTDPSVVALVYYSGEIVGALGDEASNINSRGTVRPVINVYKSAIQ